MICPVLRVGCWSPHLLMYWGSSLPLDQIIVALYVFKCSSVGCIYIYIYYILLMYWSFIIILCPPLSLFTAFDLMSVLSKYSYSCSLLVSVYMEYLFPFLHFSLCVSLQGKWLSCKLHIVGSFFNPFFKCSLYLLNGESDLFTFQVLLISEGFCHFIVY